MRPMIRRRTLVCAMLAFAVTRQLAGHETPLSTVSTAQSAAGELDPTFSADGKETTDVGGSDFGRAVAIQPDGKIIVVGGTYMGAETGDDFALARYNPDGSLDTTFAGDGTQVTDFGGSDDAWAVAIQADGKIVVVGSAGTDFALVRYDADGSLDPTFSDDGKLTTDWGGERAAAFGVALQADGKIVVVGSAVTDFVLARYNSNGSLDTAFSDDGKETTDFGGFAGARAVAIQADGKIVVVGSASTGFALARYDTDGSLDPTFSDDGKLTTGFGGDQDAAYDVALQDDGKIVAVGSTSSFQASATSFALARYNPDGSLDYTFGPLLPWWGGGRVITSFSGTDEAFGVAFQRDGKIVVVGYGLTDARGEIDFALARYNPDGSLDGTFSDDGMHTTDFGGNDWASGVALQPDGKIIAAGGTGGDFALARYESGSGSPDSTAPETTITGGPADTANDSTPTFSFDSSEVGSTFACRVDGSAFFTCNSPHTISALSDGPHSFEVRATDATGNADPSPAGRGFSVDTTAPETTVTGGPAGTTVSNTPTFTFASSEGDSTFVCRLDDSVLFPCGSPYAASPLGTGSHTFEVRATDGSGNMDPTPASRSWTIVSNYQQVVLATAGLVSYWRLGEASGTIAADAIGANTGRYRNGALLDRPGALLNDSNASASFDGSNDFVRVADSVSLDVEDSFTLEAWVKRSGISSSTRTVLSKGSGSFGLSFVNDVLTLTKNNSGTIAKASVSTTDTTGFHHIVATKSGPAVKLYIDGVVRTGTVTNRTIANSVDALNIGRDTAGSKYFSGLIDEVAIYNLALSAAQVQQHFEASGR